MIWVGSPQLIRDGAVPSMVKTSGVLGGLGHRCFAQSSGKVVGLACFDRAVQKGSVVSHPRRAWEVGAAWRQEGLEGNILRLLVI